MPRNLVAQKAQRRGLEQQQRGHERAEEFDLLDVSGHGDGFDYKTGFRHYLLSTSKFQIYALR